MPHTETLSIEGMTCQHCVRAVRDALAGVPGATVEDVQVGHARVRTEGADASRAALVAAIEAEGYTVTGAGPTGDGQ